MFSRIKEAIRIISYRESDSGPDAVIECEAPTTPTPEGKFISRALEFFIAASTIGWVSGRIGEYLLGVGFAKHISVSVSTLIGAVAVLLAMIVSAIGKDLEMKLRSQVRIADALAPFFGRKLDEAVSALKGSMRVSS
jgi:hypothetical protein